MPIHERELVDSPVSHEKDPVAVKVEYSCPDCRTKRTFVIASDIWRMSCRCEVECRVSGHGKARLRLAGPA